MCLRIFFVFNSLEGEGPYTGRGTVYTRVSGCNFTCLGFNNPEMEVLTNKVLGFNPKDYDDIKGMPAIKKGCDSLYSHDRRFNHTWRRYTTTELAQALTDLIPGKSWVMPTGLRWILSLTGGEPTLQGMKLIDLLMEPLLDDVEEIIIETNCSVPLKADFIEGLNDWIAAKPRLQRKVIWSNSPKLSVSGEKWDVAINPSIAWAQHGVTRFHQYFKFVCDGTDENFDEVYRAMGQYGAECGVGVWENIYIMPVCCTEDQQMDIAAEVAMKAIAKGYIYCHRVHSSLFNNAVGT